MASGREHTLGALKSRETGGTSVPGTPDEPLERCERRRSHFDSESLRSCQTHVSILKHAEVEMQTRMKLSSRILCLVHLAA
jgi:hypothetical protein